MAISTNVELHSNGEKLGRINDHLGEINGDLNKAEHSAKEITSFWYYLKNKVKRMVGFSQN